MATDRIRALANGLSQVVKPEMVSRGFHYDSSTRTFRKPSGVCIQIVDFQVGVRTMEGQFTVNLAVYHPEYRNPAPPDYPDRPREFNCLYEFRKRLSRLRDTPFTKFFRFFLRNSDGWLVTPTDYWWPFTSDEAQVAKELGLVRRLLLDRGLAWLDRNSDVPRLRANHDKMLLRMKSAGRTP